MSQADTASARLLLVLTIIDGTVQAGLVRVAGATEVLATSDLRPFGSADEFVVNTDQCLQELGQESEGVNETVCVVSNNWMLGDSLNDVGQKHLKKLRQDLGLELVGFLNSTETLAASLVSDAGTRLLISLTDSQGVVAVVGAEGMISQESYARTADGSELSDILDKTTADNEEPITEVVVCSLTFGPTRLAQEKGTAEQIIQTVIAGAKVVTVAKDSLVAGLLQQAGGALSGVEPDPVPTSEHVPVAAAEPTTEEETEDEEVVEAETNEVENPNANVVPVDLNAANAPKKSAGAAVAAPAATGAASFGVPIASRLSQSQEEAVEQPAAQMHLLPSSKKKKIILYSIGAVFLGLLVTAAIGWVYLRQITTVVASIQLDKQVITESTTITIDPTLEESDPENSILVAEIIEEAATDSAEIETSGAKIVGEKATGTVTIYNKSSSDKTFDEGTRISSGEYEFELTDDVTVDAAKETSSSKNYGSAEVDVIALNIGVEHNLEEGTNFRVDSFSSDTYSAEAEDDFSGGSSREVRVVAEDDLVKLRNELRLVLLGQVTDLLEEQSTDGNYVIPTGQTTIVTEEFNAEVGDEVEKITLKLGVASQGILYKRDDLLPLATEIISAKIPDGYVLIDEPQVLSDPINDTDITSSFKLQVDISAKTIPEVQLEELKQSLQGRGIEDVANILKEKSVVKQATVTVRPELGKYVVSTISDLQKVELVIEE